MLSYEQNRFSVTICLRELACAYIHLNFAVLRLEFTGVDVGTSLDMSGEISVRIIYLYFLSKSATSNAYR